MLMRSRISVSSHLPTDLSRSYRAVTLSTRQICETCGIRRHSPTKRDREASRYGAHPLYSIAVRLKAKPTWYPVSVDAMSQGDWKLDALVVPAGRGADYRRYVIHRFSQPDQRGDEIC